MNLEKENRNLKTALMVASILLIGCFVYIFQFANDTKILVRTVKEVKTEQQIIEEKLNKLKTDFDEALLKKTKLSGELELERDKVSQLLVLLAKSGTDPNVLASIKNQSSTLEASAKSLIAKNDAAFAILPNYKIRIDSVVATKNDIVVKNQNLDNQVNDLNKVMQTASKIAIVNANIRPVSYRANGIDIESNIAEQVEQLKVSYTIPENILAKAENKIIYIQIKDKNENVIGENKTVTIGDKSLNYSCFNELNYQNKTMQVLETVFVRNKLIAGEYTVRFYHNNVILYKDSFILN
jgi:hypothetical protein